MTGLAQQRARVVRHRPAQTALEQTSQVLVSPHGISRPVWSPTRNVINVSPEMGVQQAIVEPCLLLPDTQFDRRVTRHKDDTSHREDARMIDSPRPALRATAALSPVLVLSLLSVIRAFAATAAAPDKRPSVAAPVASADFRERPVGPRGLEPGARLFALPEQRVELGGHLVQRSDTSGPLIVAPVPVILDDENESFSDDLPVGVAYLHPLDARTAEAVQCCRDAVRDRGRLEIDRVTESDGRQLSPNAGGRRIKLSFNGVPRRLDYWYHTIAFCG